MRNLSMGPETQKLIDNYKKYRGGPTQHIHDDDGTVEGCPGCFYPDWIIGVVDDMTRMLERWLDDSWCWKDASPARICGGPHVLVRYHFPNATRQVDVIEHKDRVGQAFEGAEYVIVEQGTGEHRTKRAVPVRGRDGTDADSVV